MRTSIIVVTAAVLATGACETTTTKSNRQPSAQMQLQQAREEAVNANERAQQAERSAADNAREAEALHQEVDTQRRQLAEAQEKAAQAAQDAQNARAEAEAARQQSAQARPETVIQYEARPSPNPTRSRVPANVQPSDVVPGDLSSVPVNIDPDDDTARRNVDQSNGPVTPPPSP